GVPVPGVLRYRRGTRGRGPALAGPPPVLAGQAIPLAEERNGASAPEEAPAGAAAAEEPRAGRKPARGQRDDARRAAQPAAAKAQAASPSAAPAAESFPTEPAAVIARLSAYKGVGRKTAETLVEALGAGNVFPTLRDAPDRIREALGGGRRAELLIAAWQAEAAATNDQAEAAAAPAPTAEAAEAGATAPARRGRGRRGGRRGGRKGKASEG